MVLFYSYSMQEPGEGGNASQVFPGPSTSKPRGPLDGNVTVQEARSCFSGKLCHSSLCLALGKL